MRALGVALVVVVGTARLAGAQVAAEPAPAEAAPEAIANGAPHQAVEPRRAHPAGGLGGSLGFGAVQQGGSTGWMARFDYEIFPVMAPRNGGVMGFVTGFEYWHDAREGGRDHGFAIPVAMVVGARVFPNRLVAGIGFDVFNVDAIAGDTGAGAFSPLAMASASIKPDGGRARSTRRRAVRSSNDICGRVGVDARVVRRLQLGADDFTQYQLGISVGYTMSTERSARP